MYSPNPGNDICHQTYTQFTSGLPPLPPLSPLILGSLHTPDFAQWHGKHLEYPIPKPIPFSNLQVGPSSETATREHANETLNHNDTDTKDEKPVIKPLRLELGTEISTRAVSIEEHLSTATQKDDSGSSSTCAESNSVLVDLPPLHNVGAFHAHALVVEMLAPAMERGSSHHAEVMCTKEVGSKNCDVPTSPSPKPVIDLEFLSFSPLFSSQHDNAVLSPTWKLELTFSSSWHLAAKSAISLSQPAGQGSSLVRRPATRRKSVADPNSPKLLIRKSPYMNGSRTLLDLSQKRSSPESGILRAMNSPVLKSHGYRVRFQEVETW